jgi:hypothetical protein
MNGIGQRPEQPDLILFDSGGDSRSGPTRVLTTQCFDGSFGGRQRLALKMSVHPRKSRQ